jgi:hypothetical protein
MAAAAVHALDADDGIKRKNFIRVNPDWPSVRSASVLIVYRKADGKLNSALAAEQQRLALHGRAGPTSVCDMGEARPML